MDEEQASQTGGFHFGKVGGDVKIDAGGDIVAGDKTTTTTVHNGFKEEKDKEEFARQIDTLRASLRQMKSQIEGLEGFDEDDRDQIVMAIMQQVTALKEVQEEASGVPAGTEAPKDKAEIVGDYLDKTATLMKKLQIMGEKTVEFAEKVAPVVAKSLPILASARHLFGLP